MRSDLFCGVRILLLLCLAAALSTLLGCASTQSKDYAAYLAATQSVAGRPPEPLVRIRAQPGQTIEFRGVEVLEIYAAPGPHGAAVIAPPIAVTGPPAK